MRASDRYLWPSIFRRESIHIFLVTLTLFYAVIFKHPFSLVANLIYLLCFLQSQFLYSISCSILLIWPFSKRMNTSLSSYISLVLCCNFETSIFSGGESDIPPVLPTITVPIYFWFGVFRRESIHLYPVTSALCCAVSTRDLFPLVANMKYLFRYCIRARIWYLWYGFYQRLLRVHL